MNSKARGHIQAIGFIVFHFAQIRLAAFHDHVAGGASAVAAAGMLKVHSVVHGDIEERGLLPMLAVGHSGRIKLDRHASRQKSNFRHILSIACSRTLQSL